MKSKEFKIKAKEFISNNQKLALIRLMSEIRKPDVYKEGNGFKGLRDLKDFADNNFNIDSVHRLWNFSRNNLNLNRKI